MDLSQIIGLKCTRLQVFIPGLVEITLGQKSSKIIVRIDGLVGLRTTGLVGKTVKNAFLGELGSVDIYIVSSMKSEAKDLVSLNIDLVDDKAITTATIIGKRIFYTEESIISFE